MKTELMGGAIILGVLLLFWVLYKISKGAKAEQQAKDLKGSQKKTKKINEKLAEKDKEFAEDKKKYKKGRTATERNQSVKPWWMRRHDK